MSENVICESLDRFFVGNCEYKVSNAFIFKSNWESDFFVQKQNGYAYEFEVKISRSDFFADKKKVDKHMILSSGKFMLKKHKYNEQSTCKADRWIVTEEEKEHSFRPNKFFYVVPSGMITVDELPPYAGLYYYDENGGTDYSCNLKKIKDAPFMHKEKLRFEYVLCKKFYYYWMEEKSMAKRLKRDLEKYNQFTDPETTDTQTAC